MLNNTHIMLMNCVYCEFVFTCTINNLIKIQMCDRRTNIYIAIIDNARVQVKIYRSSTLPMHVCCTVVGTLVES